MNFTIPVAFDIQASSEEEAARGLVRLLEHRNLVGEQTLASMTIPGDIVRIEVECWWTPNHPFADGSDTGDPILVWQEQEAHA